MTIKPTQDDWSFASAIHSEFSAKPESQFIASRYTLAHLSALVSEARPKRVLEIGAGIGTVTKLLLSHPVKIGLVVSTEAHDGCRRELSQNIQASDSWRLCYDVEEAATNRPFDLIVLDGEVEPAHCSLLNEEAVFFVEGSRSGQRQMMQQRLFEQTGKKVVFEQYAPPKRLRLKARLILGIIPKFKFKRPKGCFVGRVTSSAY
jgi:protein-L-isoaspartate O-methyltransferase